MVVSLDMSHCASDKFIDMSSKKVFNLRYVDLSFNKISYLNFSIVENLKNLRILKIGYNPITNIFFDVFRNDVFDYLHTIDLSGIRLPNTYWKTLIEKLPQKTPNIEKLFLLNISLYDLRLFRFGKFSKLKDLDLTFNKLTLFDKDIFTDLDDLRFVNVDNYKLCCSKLLPPGFNLANCLSPTDELSSCEALLQSDIYRVALSLLACIVLLGNTSSLVYRTILVPTNSKSSFGLFVTSLCVSDFLMGIYLAIIGVADRMFLGSYLWADVTWKSSFFCSLAGVLAVGSSEISALIVCLITLDRLLVICFPLKFHLHISPKTSFAFNCLAWTAGLVLAAVPLVGGPSLKLYGQTGICVPLPITKLTHSYVFGVMIVFNFLLFAFVGVGQCIIFISLRSSGIGLADQAAIAQRTTKNKVVARRLFAVMMSNFLCWFPICVLGMMSATGTEVSGQVNVAFAIFVLPLNSALNPFLYTINVIAEKRKKIRIAKLEKKIIELHRNKKT